MVFSRFGRCLAGVLLLAVAAASPALAQRVDLTPDRFAYSPDASYDDAIPTPESELGYPIGEAFTLYAHVVDYFETLAAASDRITLHPYGTTYEGRPLVYAVITHPDNHGRIEEIKANNRRLAAPNDLSTAEREQLLNEQPVVVSYSYNIHGNEASSTEAAMQAAYHYAASTDPAVLEQLRNSVVLFWPTVNPDGRDRYVYWYKSMRRDLVATEPDDIAHDEPWPQGRTNHYWFDLNRDWVWNVHPEMEGLTDAYQEWLPQVHADYHEQGYEDHYFTMPGTTPRNPLLPEPYPALADSFGRAHIQAFDDAGVTYFTGEAFDFFYPSYGSSYPSIMGGIGMLTEQAGINAGRAIENEDGYVLTLQQRVFDHYETTLATLETAVRNRQTLLQYFVDAHRPEATKTVDTAAYIFPDDEGNGRLYDVLRVLRRHGVTVQRATGSLQVRDALDYRTGTRADRRFDAGTFVVPADQPRHLFATTILERQVAFDDSVMYDMSTWSAPLAFNVEAYATNRGVSGNLEALDAVPMPEQGLLDPNARYAFLVDWKQRNAPQALSHLWAEGYRVRAAHEPFMLGSRTYAAGTLIVFRGRNFEKDDLAGDMGRIADAAGVQIVGVNTGRTSDGPDLGSENNAVLKQPAVGLLVDQPFSTYTSGQIWYLFDQETRLPITRIRASTLSQSGTGDGQYARYGKADLADLDVLVLPGAYGLEAVFDSSGQAELAAWVRNGGTLVATEESATFFTQEASGFTEVEAVEDTTDAIGPTTPFAARGDSLGLANIPGAAMNGVLDATHPLAFGMGPRVYSLKYGSDALVPSPELQTVGRYADDPADLLVSGYASQHNLQKLAGNAFAATLEVGRGRVVFLVDNTQYRMFWTGPARLMQNAVMLVPALVD